MSNPVIDLRRNYPVLESQHELINELFQVNSWLLNQPFAMAPAEGSLADRRTAAEWLSRPDYPVPMERVFLGSGGHYGCLVAMLAGGLKGKTIAVEEYTYATFKQLAILLDVHLVPVQLDEGGLILDSLAKACAKEKISALYFMPTVHNPVGSVMSIERRLGLVELAKTFDLLLIEDDAYGFLDEQNLPSFAMLAPDRTFYIHSFSKPYAPGLKVAYFVVPLAMADKVAAALSATASNSMPLISDICSTMIRDGSMDAVIQEKRKEGARCQQIARTILTGLTIQAHPNSWHLWAELPKGINSKAFASAAYEAGVEVNDSTNFYAPGTIGIEGIRIGLGGAKNETEMVKGLEILRDVLAGYKRH